MKLSTFISVFVLCCIPQAVLACEKCYGGAAAGSPEADAISVAMLALIAVTGFVLTAITTFFFLIRRRQRLLASGNFTVTESGALVAHAPGTLNEN